MAWADAGGPEPGERGLLARPVVALARFGLSRPWAAAASLAMLVGAALWAITLPSFVVDNSPEGFAVEGDPAQQVLETFRRELGSDTSIALMVSGDVYTDELAARLEGLRRAAVDRVRALTGQSPATVISLVDLVGDERVGPLRGEQLRRAVQRNAYAVGALVDAAGRHTLIAMRLPPARFTELEKISRAVGELAAASSDDSFRAEPVGPLPMTVRLNDLTLRDMGRLTLISFALVVLTLALLFRNAMAVVAPVVLFVLALLATLGSMALLGIRPTLVGGILPAFLIAVVAGDSIHLLQTFRDLRGRYDEPVAAALEAVRIVAAPVVMTSVTTMAGLASLAVVGSRSVAELGTSSAIGVGWALLLTVGVLPAVMVKLGRGFGRVARDDDDGMIARLARACADLSRGMRGRRAVLLLVAVLALSCVSALGRLTVVHEPMRWAPADDPVRAANERFDRTFGGMGDVTLMLTPQAGHALLDEDVLRALERFEHHLRTLRLPSVEGPVIGPGWGVLDPLRIAYWRMQKAGERSLRLPERDEDLRTLVGLVSLKEPSPFAQVATPSLSRGMMTFRARWLAATDYAKLQEHIEAGARLHLQGLVDMQPTGTAYLLLSMLGRLVRDLASSFLVAFLTVAVVLFAFVRNLRLGLIAMLPNLPPVLAILAAMALLEIPLDLSNLLVASIVIGVSVDDTIHFMHRFVEARRDGADVESAIAAAVRRCGRAMIATTIVLTAASGVYVVATLSNFRVFGALIAGAVVLAMLADLVFLPALLRAFAPGDDSGVLRGETVRVADLRAADREAMWTLFATYYDDVDRTRFDADLAGKQAVFILRDGYALRGFSTVAYYEQEVDGRRVGVVFSGDTIIDRRYWGQTALHRQYFKLFVRAKLRAPLRPLYWFMISKGYKTYLVIARNVPKHWPRHDRETPPDEQRIIDVLSTARFGAAYRAELGVVQFPEPSGKLRERVAPIDDALLARDPAIAYFAARNPGYERGDELSCIGEIDWAMVLWWPMRVLRKALFKPRRGR